jgi:hypothetical protein
MPSSITQFNALVRKMHVGFQAISLKQKGIKIQGKWLMATKHLPPSTSIVMRGKHLAAARDFFFTTS